MSRIRWYQQVKSMIHQMGFIIICLAALGFCSINTFAEELLIPSVETGNPQGWNVTTQPGQARLVHDEAVEQETSAWRIIFNTEKESSLQVERTIREPSSKSTAWGLTGRVRCSGGVWAELCAISPEGKVLAWERSESVDAWQTIRLLIPPTTDATIRIRFSFKPGKPESVGWISGLELTEEFNLPPLVHRSFSLLNPRGRSLSTRECDPKDAFEKIGSPLPLRPIICRSGTLYYSDGGEVALWGTNFQTPLFWEYRYESKPAGIPLESDALNKLTDDNLESVQRIGVQVLRVHLNPSDLADKDGGLRESPFLKALDHLMRRCRERGLYVYLTLINDQGTHFFPDSFMAGYRREQWLLSPDFQKSAQHYIGELLNHVNSYDGIVLKADPALAVVELVNEPAYPTYNLLRMNPSWTTELARYGSWLDGKNIPKSLAASCFSAYRYERVSEAIAHLFSTVRATGAKQPVIWNLNWPGMITEHEDVFQAVCEAKLTVSHSACILDNLMLVKDIGRTPKI